MKQNSRDDDGRSITQVRARSDEGFFDWTARHDDAHPSLTDLEITNTSGW